MTNRIQQEIKDLQDKLVKLQKELALITNAPQTEPTINFKGLSYHFLMAYYIEHDRITPEVYAAWREAYQVFKDKRINRDTKIDNLVALTVTDFNGQLLDTDTVIKIVFDRVKALYETLTPFDCEDEKWLDKLNNESWDIRIKKKVHACLRDYTIEQGIIKPTLRKKWVVDLRK